MQMTLLLRDLAPAQPATAVILGTAEAAPTAWSDAFKQLGMLHGSMWGATTELEGLAWLVWVASQCTRLNAEAKALTQNVTCVFPQQGLVDDSQSPTKFCMGPYERKLDTFLDAWEDRLTPDFVTFAKSLQARAVRDAFLAAAAEPPHVLVHSDAKVCATLLALAMSCCPATLTLVTRVVYALVVVVCSIRTSC